MGLGEWRAPSCSEDRALKTGSSSVKANNNHGRSEGGVRPKAGLASFAQHWNILIQPLVSIRLYPIYSLIHFKYLSKHITVICSLFLKYLSMQIIDENSIAKCFLIIISCDLSLTRLGVTCSVSIWQTRKPRLAEVRQPLQRHGAGVFCT